MLWFVFERLASNFSAPGPPAPPGFKVVHNFSHQLRIDPIGVYLDSIAAIGELSVQLWSGRVDPTWSGMTAVSGSHVVLNILEIGQGF